MKNEKLEKLRKTLANNLELVITLFCISVVGLISVFFIEDYGTKIALSLCSVGSLSVVISYIALYIYFLRLRAEWIRFLKARKIQENRLKQQGKLIEFRKAQ
jgi:hypothetical protein